MKFTNGVMQGPLGDIGRHGDNLDDIRKVDSGHEDF